MSHPLRHGVRLACDPGKARIGIARTDPRGSMALPMDAVKADDRAIATIASIADEYEAIEIYVGLPLRMDGTRGPAAEWAQEWARDLAASIPLPVYLVDERLTTVEAQRGLHAAGRSTRTSRSVIDSASACILLESCLNAEGSTGTVPGHPIGTIDQE